MHLLFFRSTKRNTNCLFANLSSASRHLRIFHLRRIPISNLLRNIRNSGTIEVLYSKTFQTLSNYLLFFFGFWTSNPSTIRTTLRNSSFGKLTSTLCLLDIRTFALSKIFARFCRSCSIKATASLYTCSYSLWALLHRTHSSICFDIGTSSKL